MMDYQIHSAQTTPHEDLIEVVKTHLKTPWQKPISDLQINIYNRIVSSFDLTSACRTMMLDSGCGTGKSTRILAKQYPEHCVLGVDKSIARLKANYYSAHNVALVRADLIDFWRLMVRDGIKAEQHTLFYPNPYPKKSQFKKRWPGHPVFPVLMQTADHFVIRANWRVYLEEFQLAASIVRPELKATLTMVVPNESPMSLFETKYFNAEIPCYELVLKFASSGYNVSCSILR